MRLKVIPRRIRAAAKLIRREAAVFSRTRRRSRLTGSTSQESTALADVRRNGYAIVPEFWPREAALKMRDRLEAYLAEGVTRQFDNGAYVVFRDKSRKDDSDVRRIYHVERLVPELEDFRREPLIFRVAAAYYGVPMHSGVLVFQHNPKTSTDTRYYHVDIWGREFKAFLYLDDVDQDNGPFTYLRGSHKLHLLRLKRMILRGEHDTSMTRTELDSIMHREVQIAGEAGTLILADVSGIHRGLPQINRSRSILANYVFDTPGDRFFEKSDSQ